MKKLILLILSAFVLLLCGCSDNEVRVEKNSEKIFQDGDIIGEGKKTFELTVKYEDGKSEKCTVKTDKETLGDALLEYNIISGDSGEYGLYVKKVNGVEADYEKTKTYWGLYINGEYATTGADAVKIKDGEKYSFEIGK